MKKTILIIEDNAENMYLVHFLLERSGYRILVADDGPEGLRVAAAELPDLVLMDIGLPQMDGYEVTGVIVLFMQIGALSPKTLCRRGLQPSV